MCCSQCHPHLSNTAVPVGLLYRWVTSDAPTHQDGHLYLSASSLTPHLTADTGWVRPLFLIYPSPVHLVWNLLSSLCECSYRASQTDSSPSPVQNIINIHRLGWLNQHRWAIQLWIGQIQKELKRPCTREEPYVWNIHLIWLKIGWPA